VKRITKKEIHKQSYLQNFKLKEDFDNTEKFFFSPFHIHQK